MDGDDQDLFPPRYSEPALIASGGMSELFSAVDEVLGRTVAIKLLSEQFSTDASFRARFRREALAAARLSGEPHTVTVFDVGEWRERLFIVMEYLGGGTLQQALRAGSQPVGRSLAWIGQAARSLDAAHEHGVVHRDVKPANLLLDEEGNVHVGDFGIATATGLDSLTLTGTVLGTVGYLAPEQAQGRPVTGAADGYALAVVAFELLTGVRPFERESSLSEAAAHAYAPVPSASGLNPELPPAVDDVFRKALAKSPAVRYSTSAGFVTALRSACAMPSSSPTRSAGDVADDDRRTELIRPRRRRGRALRWGAGLVLLAAGALAGWVVEEVGRAPSRSAAGTTTRIVTRTTTVSAAATTVAPPTTSVAGPPAAGSTTGDASDLNTRGYRLMLAGKYSAAVPLLQQAVAGLSDPRDPVTAYANFNLGQSLVRLGQCAAALPYLRRAAGLEPTSDEARAALVYAQACAGGGSTEGVAADRQPPGPGPGPGPKGHGRGHQHH